MASKQVPTKKVQSFYLLHLSARHHALFKLHYRITQNKTYCKHTALITAFFSVKQFC